MLRFTAILCLFAVLLVDYGGAQRKRRPRISQSKCVEYAKFVYENITIPSLFGGDEYEYDEEAEPKVEYRLNSLCGHVSQPLIANGVPAKEREYPHQALIGYERSTNYKEYLCGGSLISEQFVLSAAHCTFHFNLKKAKYALLGDVSRKGPQDNSYKFEIIDRIAHPEYNRRAIDNDIILFKLDQVLKLEKYKGFIRPICLPQTDIDYTPPGRTRTNLGKVIATGYGSEGFGEDNTDNLQKVKIEFYDQSKCQETYKGDLKLPNGMNRDIMICAGSNEGKDTCSGDSGGPLQVYNTDKDIYCMYTIVGITSFGAQNCGSSPAVYTKVFHYLDWIEGIVWPLNS